MSLSSISTSGSYCYEVVTERQLHRQLTLVVKLATDPEGAMAGL